eukprot:240555-Amphidinium_carterae.1
MFCARFVAELHAFIHVLRNSLAEAGLPKRIALTSSFCYQLEWGVFRGYVLSGGTMVSHSSPPHWCGRSCEPAPVVDRHMACKVKKSNF